MSLRPNYTIAALVNVIPTEDAEWINARWCSAAVKRGPQRQADGWFRHQLVMSLVASRAQARLRKTAA